MQRGEEGDGDTPPAHLARRLPRPELVVGTADLRGTKVSSAWESRRNNPQGLTCDVSKISLQEGLGRTP